MDKFVWIFKLIAVVASYAPKLWPFPNHHDALALRSWLTAAVDVFKKVAANTEMLLDDQAAALFERIVASDEIYPAFYELLLNILHNDEEAAMLMACPSPCPDGRCPAAVKAFAESAGFDPATVLLIVQAVMTIIEFFRKRKDA